jgi:cytochrome oxidase Cu insertion factor (SCO1/SenC/PrrC family)
MLLAATGALAGLAIAVLVVWLPARRTSGGQAAAAEPGAEYLLPSPRPAQDFGLTTHTGATTRLSELGKDRVLALFFGYTQCPDVCPLTMANLGRALDLLEDPRYQGAMITIDPRRDSLPVLADYVGRFSPRIVGLTGPIDTLAAAALAYMQSAERPPEPAPHEHGAESPTQYMLAHSAYVMVVKDGRLLMAIPHDATHLQLASALGLASMR